MIQKGFSYFAPLQKYSDTQFDSALWKKVFSLYEKRKYKDSFLTLLKYADKKIGKYKTSDGVYRIPHGSVFVDIEIQSQDIYIKADFVKLPEKGRIPLYRKIAEMNFSGLNLAEMKQKDDVIYLEYRCPLATYEPHKVFDALLDICYFADQYDDEFIEKFSAIQIQEGDIVEVSEKQKTKAWQDFQSIVRYAQDTIEDLEKQRKNSLVWDTLSTTFKMIDTTFSPQGTTKLDLGREIGKLYSRSEPLQNIIYQGKEYLSSLAQMDEAQFSKDLYSVNVFFPHKKVATNEQVSDYIRAGYSDAFNLFKSGNLDDAYLMLHHILYNALYYHMMSKGMEKTIRKVLRQHSGMKIETSKVESFFVAVGQIVNLQNIERNASGFWGIVIAVLFFILGTIFNA